MSFVWFLRDFMKNVFVKDRHLSKAEKKPQALFRGVILTEKHVKMIWLSPGIHCSPENHCLHSFLRTGRWIQQFHPNLSWNECFQCQENVDPMEAEKERIKTMSVERLFTCGGSKRWNWSLFGEIIYLEMAFETFKLHLLNCYIRLRGHFCHCFGL